MGWLTGCCGLPAWRCGQGSLHPMEAEYCPVHGEPRPPWHKVAHEADELWQGGGPEVDLRVRRLDPPPRIDGASAPALSGNVLAYVTEAGEVVVVDFRRYAARLRLVEGVRAAVLVVSGGELRAALHLDSAAPRRWVAWELADLRAALRAPRPPRDPRPIDPMAVPAIALPQAAGAPTSARLHWGTGARRLIVEHDPVVGPVATVYTDTTGGQPGEYLVRRPPCGTTGKEWQVRPQDLYQLPAAVPGGTLLMGRIRWFGDHVDGALVLPHLRRRWPGA